MNHARTLFQRRQPTQTGAGERMDHVTASRDIVTIAQIQPFRQPAHRSRYTSVPRT